MVSARLALFATVHDEPLYPALQKHSLGLLQPPLGLIQPEAQMAESENVSRTFKQWVAWDKVIELNKTQSVRRTNIASSEAVRRGPARSTLVTQRTAPSWIAVTATRHGACPLEAVGGTDGNTAVSSGPS